ncbi:MAG TPA: GH25 family lysozyme [Polyangiaceae bacterium]|nr:GH25 family lysozyme [Polyangiaceae bacterium]
MRILGIDVSHYQGSVRWSDVAASDVKFAFAKATEANTAIDATFEQNWRGIQQAGLFRGTYHFGRPAGDPETQAAHFFSVVGQLGFRDLPPVLDLEVADGRSAQQILEWARAFLAKAEALFGRKLMLYTGQFWRGPLGNPNDSFFAERALWLAAYTREQSLVVPASWKRWTFWQYTDGSHNEPARVPGVPPCDQSWFEGSEADLDALCTGEPPVIKPVDCGAADPWPGVHFVWPQTPAVRGTAVKAWQEKLRALGFAIDADGVYGPQSKVACIAFQRSRGLAPDGIVGKATWAAAFAS